MARWSPTTPISNGPTLGDVLRQGVDSYFDRRDRDRELERQHKREDVVDAQREEARQYAISQRPLADALGQRAARQEGVVPHEAVYSLGDALGGQPADGPGRLAGQSLGIGGRGGGTAYDSPLAQAPAPMPRLGTFDTKTGTFVRQLPEPTQHREGVQHLTSGYDYDPAQDRGDPRQAGNLAEIQARHEAAMAEIIARGQYGQGAPGTPARRDPVQDHKDIRDYDIRHPLPTRAAQGGGALGVDAQKLKPVPSAAYNAYRTNQTQLLVLQRALDGIAANPNATGWKGYIPGPLLNRSKAKGAQDGIGVRADIADVGSLKIHERSGAAVTVSEFPRLQPFIPSATDDSHTVAVKLQRMKEILQEETDAMASFYTPEQGYRGMGPTVASPTQAPASTGNIDLRTPPLRKVSSDDADRILQKYQGMQPKP